MRRLSIHPTLSSRLLRVAFVLGTAALLAALAAAPASAHAERQVGRYSFVIGFGTEPAYAGQPNSLQVLISRDGKPATDLAGQLDGLMAHAYYGSKADLKLENAMMPLEPILRRRLGHAGRLPVVLRADPARGLHLRPRGQARRPEDQPGRPERARDVRGRQRPGQDRPAGGQGPDHRPARPAAGP